MEHNHKLALLSTLFTTISRAKPLFKAEFQTTVANCQY